MHEASFLENCEIMKDYSHLLELHGIQPVVVITPFTTAYNKYIDQGYKASILEMLDKIPKEVHFMDFNDCEYFDDKDFTDTDHLNADGAAKFSYLLNEMIGRI